MTIPAFEIDSNYSFFMSLLAKYLERKEKYKISDIINQAEFEIHSGYTYDNLGGGIYGHKIVLRISPEIFLDILDEKDDIAGEVKVNLNKIYSNDNECIDTIDILPSNSISTRPTHSFALYNQNKLPNVTNADISRIWGDKANLRIFISHRDAHKVEASTIQRNLLKVGISSFVAHEDINPTEEWVKEILRALQSMDLFLVYMKDDFFESIWTNQEIGFALGRNIPIIPIKNTINPEGFLSILQGKVYNEKSFTLDFVTLLLATQTMPDEIKLKIIDCLISGLEKSSLWADSELCCKGLECVESLPLNQVDRVITAFNANNRVNRCIYVSGYDLRGSKRGAGVISNQLKKWTGNDYEVRFTNGKVSVQEINNDDGDLAYAFPSTMDDVPF